MTRCHSSGMKSLRGFADFRDLLDLPININQKGQGIWLHDTSCQFESRSYMTLNVIST